MILNITHQMIFLHRKLERNVSTFAITWTGIWNLFCEFLQFQTRFNGFTNWFASAWASLDFIWLLPIQILICSKPECDIRIASHETERRHPGKGTNYISSYSEISKCWGRQHSSSVYQQNRLSHLLPSLSWSLVKRWGALCIGF